MLCRRHHRQIHSTEWIVRIRDGLPEFIPPKWIDFEQKPRRRALPHLAAGGEHWPQGMHRCGHAGRRRSGSSASPEPNIRPVPLQLAQEIVTCRLSVSKLVAHRHRGVEKPGPVSLEIEDVGANGLPQRTELQVHDVTTTAELRGQSRDGADRESSRRRGARQRHGSRREASSALVCGRSQALPDLGVHHVLAERTERAPDRSVPLGHVPRRPGVPQAVGVGAQPTAAVPRQPRGFLSPPSARVRAAAAGCRPSAAEFDGEVGSGPAISAMIWGQRSPHSSSSSFRCGAADLIGTCRLRERPGRVCAPRPTTSASR